MYIAVVCRSSLSAVRERATVAERLSHDGFEAGAGEGTERFPPLSNNARGMPIAVFVAGASVFATEGVW